MSIQTFSFNRFSVSFQENGYLNATAIAEQYDKRVGNYLRNERTQEYITALNERLFNPETRNRATAENQLVIIKKGGNDKKSQGTWLHPKLAVDFARWLNPKFAVWCDEQIETLLNGNVSDGIKSAKTTADDRTGLRQAVAALVGRKGIDYSSAYSMIHQRFNVESVEGIPAGKLPEAVAYVHALTLHTGLTGEVLDREPLPAPQPALPISGNALYDLAVAVSYGARAIQMGRDVSLPLKQLGCRQAVTMWTVWAETRSRLKAAANALEALSAHADAEHAEKIRPILPEIRNLSAV
ncbi:TPA: KilA-N domain-containing protein [Neisseria gonorrhoeae]|uniref:KilA-N domain-containing protein n=3 Tax=Neisseria gonorrhoeae TaxID=485 RepID=UPI00192DF87C|nr:KilA-N domain-containing protein [Neisseria gonorrhoeae]MCU9822028.1 KilA-N domain-containing protein [Neisseria gonorrhoeae]MDO5995360.1 KilA-N domain-containing protein [Neisseria gonorrhoeae]MDO6003322.1 KilA-N domain-containing protein [Neisseria gonorrhoeae]MDO6013242.1 KilA-N domain-containing protein [Neisseria gonorrhoeae]MDO6052422.1 KilA-N domain-containing protein [Neisseria gonorrhoeae]